MFKTIKFLMLGTILALSWDTNQRVRNISIYNKQKFKTMSQELDALQAQVEKTTTVEQSAIALLQGLKQQLDAAGTDKAKLSALSDSLGNNADALAAAITANTPAAAGDTAGAGAGDTAGAGTGEGDGAGSGAGAGTSEGPTT